MPVEKVAFEITSEEAGGRLDQVLVRRFPEFSRAYVQEQIADAKIRVNGKPARKSDPVAAGDRIEIDQLLTVQERKPAANPALNLPIVYEDNWLAVINKPAGVPSHPVRHDETDTVVNWWATHNPHLFDDATEPLRAGVVHRLDTGTSGLLIVGRSQEVVDRMQDEFRNRRVMKNYRALVHGKTPSQGAIDWPIAHDPKSKRRMMAVRERDKAVELKAREARTEFTTEEHLPTTSLVRVVTKTGRMHQVRVHLSALGFPLVGDAVYRKGNMEIKGLQMHRHFLHACYLSFTHPFTGETKTFESDLPDELSQVIEVCRNVGSVIP